MKGNLKIMIASAARYAYQWFLEVVHLVFHPKELASGLKMLR